MTFEDRYPRTVDETEPKPTRWPLTLIGALFVVATLSVVAWNVELPYLAYSAGPVSDRRRPRGGGRCGALSARWRVADADCRESGREHI